MSISITQLDIISSFGYGVYAIKNGLLDPKARFAIADPYDVDGWYLEAATINILYREFIEAGLV